MVAHEPQPGNLVGPHVRAILLGLVRAQPSGGPPGRARDATKRGLCQSVCLSGTCRIPPTKPSCGNICRAWANLRQIVLPVDRETGRPRGFAFVDYADRSVAEAAISRFDQQPFKGRPLAVSEARPREERPAGAPRPGGYGAPRPSGFGAPRPSGWAPRPADTGSPTGNRSRNFGPDAPPKNKRKPPRKDDRGPRGPIKERPVEPPLRKRRRLAQRRTCRGRRLRHEREGHRRRRRRGRIGGRSGLLVLRRARWRSVSPPPSADRGRARRPPELLDR